MIYTYIDPEVSVAQLRKSLDAFEEAGYDVERTLIGPSFEAACRRMPNGATVVVLSVDFFPSLMELLGTLAALQERGITLQSLQEPWLGQKVGSTADFLLRLRELAFRLHQNRTRQGLQKAKQAGKRSGRPKGFRKTYTQTDFLDVDRVDSLCAEEQISTVEACRRLGVSVYAYYRRRSLRRHLTAE